MPYLGPTSFKTAPLTSSNLAFLNTNLDANRSRPDIRANSNEVVPTATNTTISTTSPNTSTSNAMHKQTKPTSALTHSNNLAVANSLTDLSSNSLSAFSSNLTNNSYRSSETSIVSDTATQTHKTVRGTRLDDEDDKTVIISHTPTLAHTLAPTRTNTHTATHTHSGMDSQLLIPSSPLKAYDVVSISTDNDMASGDGNEVETNAMHFPLLRKKSGELVKSSLRLNTLSRSNSLPNTKSVRFATRLENVKFFKKSEKPTAVSSRLAKATRWDFDSEDEDYEDNEERGTGEHVELWDDKVLDEDLDLSQKWSIKSNDCPYNPLSLNFAKLASNRDVILESVKLNSLGDSLIGFVYAKNIAFEKKIIVKLTYDNWKSFVEVENANYISSNHIFKYSETGSNNSYDKFSFIIRLEELKQLTHYNNVNIEFCVQYLTNGTSFWDNNDGKNYKISLVRNQHEKVLTPPSSPTKKKNLDSLFDLDDANIRLKDNNNFKNHSTFSEKPKTDMSSLRLSNSFGLKKIRSESSIPTMKSSLPTNYNHNNRSLSTFVNEGDEFKVRGLRSMSQYSHPQAQDQSLSSRYTLSKSLAASPALPSNGFDWSTKDKTDYDGLLKQFCFFSTNDNGQGETWSYPRSFGNFHTSACTSIPSSPTNSTINENQHYQTLMSVDS